MPDHILDLDPSSLREWLAAVGILRLISETTEKGGLYWRLVDGRYRLVAEGLPDDVADRWASWVETNSRAWNFGGKEKVDFDAASWRLQAGQTTGVEAMLWCAVGSDAYEDRKNVLITSDLEYSGGKQRWLWSLRTFVEGVVSRRDLLRILDGDRDEAMVGPICRWDPACERDHAYRGKAPTNDPMSQDQTINALAAIGLVSCPSAPGQSGLVTPLVAARSQLRWPVWTQAIRVADLEAALCCGWNWPTMRARRWTANYYACFSRGELREPEASPQFP